MLVRKYRGSREGSFPSGYKYMAKSMVNEWVTKDSDSESRSKYHSFRHGHDE